MFKKILKVLKEIFIGVTIGLVIIMFVLNLLMVNYIKQELSCIYAGIDTIGDYLGQMQRRIVSDTLDGIKRDNQILKLFVDLKNIFTEKDDILSKSIETLKDQIERQSSKIEELEYNLKQITVMIINTTQSYYGSGITLKYNNNFYILSAAHLIEEENDILYLAENDEPITRLKIIIIDFERDLVLLKSENKDIIPQIYAELAEQELEKGSLIYVIGNPLGIEDVLSEGRILKNKGFFTYFVDHSYFGSSGGGIFTKEGKLLGIIQTIEQFQISPNSPFFIINGAARLSMIKDFLGDIK